MKKPRRTFPTGWNKMRAIFDLREIWKRTATGPASSAILAWIRGSKPSRGRMEMEVDRGNPQVHGHHVNDFDSHSPHGSLDAHLAGADRQTQIGGLIDYLYPQQ